MTAQLAALVLSAPPSCTQQKGTFCHSVYDITGQAWLATSAHLIVSHGSRIVLIIVVALVARYLAHRAIRRVTRTTTEGTVPDKLRPLTQRAAGHRLVAGSAVTFERRRQRAASIGSILRSIVSVVIFAVALMLVLGELGINLAPIIASAGIVGVALGFGAQNLVKDYLSGIFMLLEDQYGVGDAVDVGPASGTIEEVGLRITQLRDLYGTVWYVRNGEILRVGNKSQGYAQAVLDVPVPNSVDLEHAATLLGEIARDLAGDEEWSAAVLDEPSVLGVEALNNDSAVLRLVVKTRTGDKDAVARELRQRIKARFDADGIRAATAPGS